MSFAVGDRGASSVLRSEAERRLLVRRVRRRRRLGHGLVCHRSCDGGSQFALHATEVHAEEIALGLVLDLLRRALLSGDHEVCELPELLDLALQFAHFLLPALIDLVLELPDFAAHGLPFCFRQALRLPP